MKYIDMTPTWEEILPTLLLLLSEGAPEGQKTAREELQRMAKLADERNVPLRDRTQLRKQILRDGEIHD